MVSSSAPLQISLTDGFDLAGHHAFPALDTFSYSLLLFLFTFFFFLRPSVLFHTADPSGSSHSNTSTAQSRRERGKDPRGLLSDPHSPIDSLRDLLPLDLRNREWIIHLSNLPISSSLLLLFLLIITDQSASLDLSVFNHPRTFVVHLWYSCFIMIWTPALYSKTAPAFLGEPSWFAPPMSLLGLIAPRGFKNYEYS